MPGHSRIARLLQVACLGQLALALGWLAWRWPAAPGQAVAGALAILLVTPAALALELAIASRVGRATRLPQPAPRQLVHAWVAETAHMVRTFYWRQPFRWRAEPDHLDAGSGRVGVVLVHGFMCNRGLWNAWLRILRARGHPCIAVNLEPPYGSIDAYVQTIDTAVARLAAATQRPPVLVCHSMGGLAARAWWRARSHQADVAHIVTIGTPHRGTWLARFSGRTNGRQMRLHNAWLAQLAQHEASHPLPPCTCWYSNCDNIVFPADTATLPQADNRFVPGVPHVALAFDAVVMAGTLQLIASTEVRCQGESVTGTSPENL